MTTRLLGHERLDVYQCATEFLALSTKVLGELPDLRKVLADPERK